ncbi:MAG: hypothetical protein IJE21_01875 [Alistipes sp.]|nr:hypothetical protein [Alistipes sp.]
MRKIFLTVVLTSLFWLGVYDLVQDNQPQSVNVDLAAASEGVSESVSEKQPEKVVEASAPKPQKPQKPTKPAKNYAELILGYWTPVEGNTRPLEITKYGTVIQWIIFEHSQGKHEFRRLQYVIRGNKLTIGDFYDCTVDVIEEGGETYLEVYGHEYFAGKYRKSE